MTVNKFANQQKYPFVLPDLPYLSKASEPHMSEQTFSLHHGKHHQAYVTNLNKLIENTDLAEYDLEHIINQTNGKQDKVGIFNNAAQVWNHSFFWPCMKPKGGGKPTGKLHDKIVEDFGSFEEFCEQFKQAGTTQFGSGWAWLVHENGKLKVVKTANADTPFLRNQTPIMTADVWEHAYYVDYQNRRPDYLKVFLEHLVNWDFAADNFAKV